jgi:hypothetical protein
MITYLNLLNNPYLRSINIQQNKNEIKPVMKQLSKDEVCFTGLDYEPGCKNDEFFNFLKQAKFADFYAENLLRYANNDFITATRERYNAIVRVLKEPDTDTDSKMFLNQLKMDWRKKLGICIADLRLSK